MVLDKEPEALVPLVPTLDATVARPLPLQVDPPGFELVVVVLLGAFVSMVVSFACGDCFLSWRESTPAAP